MIEGATPVPAGHALAQEKGVVGTLKALSRYSIFSQGLAKSAPPCHRNHTSIWYVYGAGHA